MEEHNDLSVIRKDLEFLKRAVVEMQLAIKNSDVFLSNEDDISINEYLDDKIEGKLISHDELEKELGL